MFEIKPKTRKEISMAYLAGDMSLELPEPMTRDEVTLYNLCQSHAYGSTTTVKEVLAECQPFYYDGESSGEFSFFVIENQFEIVSGEKYVVNWNGAEFTSKAVEQEGILFLGNLSAFGMEDTGEPFMVRMGDGS